MGRHALAAASALARGLQLAAPASLALLALRVALAALRRIFGLRLPRRARPLALRWRLLDLYSVVEAAFALLCAAERARGQARAEHPTSSPAERAEVFERCLATVESPQRFATRWLRDHPLGQIRRGNVEDWLSWGMFGKDVSHLDPAERSEMNRYIAKFEQHSNFKLADGHNGMVRCFKFDHEPVESAHRPLVYYGIVHGLLQRVIVPLTLRALGFGPRRSGKSINYWVRRAPDGSGAKAAPIVLIHGIGVGVVPYLKFARDLINAAKAKGGDRDIVMVELPAIAQQLFPRPLLPDLFVADMTRLLNKEGWNRATFVGHSYGTFCLAWVVKRAPDLVENLAFLDPAPFLLHHSTSLRAIIYKEALTDVDRIFQYFLRSELFFNNHIRRHFFWRENLLFFEQIPKDCKALLVLSERDEIMPVPQIHAVYEQSQKHLDHIDVVQLEDHAHGELLISPHLFGILDRIVAL